MTTTTETTITKTTLASGLVRWVWADGTADQVRCPDCNAFVHSTATGRNAVIRHSKRCGFTPRPADETALEIASK